MRLTCVRRPVSFAEVGRVCRVALREPMHMCTCVNEEGGDREVVRSEMTSLLSYTLRYVSFTLKCENRPANRPTSRETGLEMPCFPGSRPVVGPNHSKLS
jgi:hypothetical protein